ncbi:serine protein kinase PrkA [bacterium]|nr:serine protein kinase PrkA [bacterium]MBU1880870.1 serine protein kinase PrkA [bacterium]
MDITKKAERLESLYNLSKVIREKERRSPILFNDFLHLLSEDPIYVLRDSFQQFHDMVHYFVPEGKDDYIVSDESIGFVHWDFNNLFVNRCDEPFFADRLFANRFMRLIDGFRKGMQKNNIYLFEGPPGSGKSLFLNNLLLKLEEYARIDEGSTFKVYWCLDVQRLGGFKSFQNTVQPVQDAVQDLDNGERTAEELERLAYPDKYLEFSCPNHDHPVLMIPKNYRIHFLDELIEDDEAKEKIFNEKQYEWVLKDIPCNICSSIFNTLLDITGEPLEVFDALRARKNLFSRQLGECVSVFNPGDRVIDRPIVNRTLQKLINDLFKSDDVRFKHSYMAKTNRGVLALMDIKEHNITRLKNFHGIISDGVHKVDLAEEHISTLFLGTINPSDTDHFEDIPSFRDRILTVNIPYVLDYYTEIAIYKNKYGSKIKSRFLPGLLENFSKIIIATRLDREAPVIRKWITSPEIYSKYLDKDMLLLKMEIYTGSVPYWLTEEDEKSFDRNTRRAVIDASQTEGYKGISGRQSLILLNDLLSYFEESESVITMEMLKEFFRERNGHLAQDIPEGFIESLEDMYDYNVLQEVKEAIYFYNEKQLTRDIINYLFAINYEPEVTKKSDFTGDKVEITEDYFKNFEAMFLGTTSSPEERQKFRKNTQNEYISKTLFQEIKQEGKSIEETEQFKSLFEKYTRNLKENALSPYAQNENFRRAIQDFGSSNFEAYDNRLKRDVKHLLDNLQKKFNYTAEGARQISIYILDKNLMSEY